MGRNQQRVKQRFKGTLSFTNGAARAVADNMFLGQTSLRETGIYSNAAAYNAGQNVGDIISIFAGAAEIINGFEEAAAESHSVRKPQEFL